MTVSCEQYGGNEPYLEVKLIALANTLEHGIQQANYVSLVQRNP